MIFSKITKPLRDKLSIDGTYGRGRIRKIANKLNLPTWWVESVIIEYFPCRRFLENEELWVFDFDIFDDNLIDTILDRHVVIPEYIIAQNIRPEDLKQRTLLGAIGQPMVPLKKEDLYPEGKLNNTAFPFLGNPIAVWDPKLSLNRYAVIYDEGYLYQWKIADLITLENMSWYKSDFVDTEPLRTVYLELMKYRTQEIRTNPTEELRKKAEKDYEELEIEREKIRQKIWDYHLKKKSETPLQSQNNLLPPKLTIFDTITLVDGKYQTRSHLEPVFYRSALRNLKLCKKSNADFRASNDQIFASSEIEYALSTIFASASCLEAYINLIIKEYTPQYDDLKDHKKKWLLIQKSLNPKHQFVENQKPFTSFAKLVDLRNTAIHYTAEFQPSLDEHTPVYENFCYENAKLIVDCIEPMIAELCKNPKIIMPNWLQKPQSTGGYWDDAFQS